MKTMFWTTCLILAAWQSVVVNACKSLEVVGRAYGSLIFHQIDLDSPLMQSIPIDMGRPAYVSNENNQTLYLYHTVLDSGEGRWVINDVLGDSENARSFITSWSILPHFIPYIHDQLSTKQWMTPYAPDFKWEYDESLSIACAPGELDRTVFFDSTTKFLNKLSGYYVQRTLSANHAYQGPIYSQIKFYDAVAAQFMYTLGNDEEGYDWVIGSEIGVDAALAMARNAILFADEITSDWYFANNDPESPWVLDKNASIISSFLYDTKLGHPDAVTPLPQVLHKVRSIPKMPSQLYYELRNGIPIPAIGLGTGGIQQEKTKEVFTKALSYGYQLFDLAREYHNEHIMGYILDNHGDTNDERFLRKNNFFETKIWPTRLGFFPTMREIFVSQAELFTSYIDLYLLHWPKCYSDIDWMHCHDTEEPSATWRESWRALEKAYSEGFIMSIGVSNFDVALLQELAEFATVLPHVVQNFAALEHLDVEVRQWCQEHHVIYQPYASIRNVATMDERIRNTAIEIAQRHGVSEHVVSLKFFLQSGASIIPRSTKDNHLKQNLALHGNWTLTNEEMAKLGSGGFGMSPFHHDDEL